MKKKNTEDNKVKEQKTATKIEKKHLKLRKAIKLELIKTRNQSLKQSGNEITAETQDMKKPFTKYLDPFLRVGTFRELEPF